MMPIMTGIMITSVQPHLRMKANALANLIYNLFGFFPAPYIYGIIANYTGGDHSRWGLKFTFFINIPAVLLIAAAIWCKKDLQEYLN